MAHKRQQIRDRVVAVLAAAGTAAGTNVESGSVYDLAVLPAIRVMTPRDQRIEEASSNDTDAQSLLLEVKLCGALTAGLDDLLDDIAADVHVALMADATLDGLTLDLELVESELELVKDSKTPHGRLTMRWGALYSVSRMNPEV